MTVSTFKRISAAGMAAAALAAGSPGAAEELASSMVLQTERPTSAEHFALCRATPRQTAQYPETRPVRHAPARLLRLRP